MTRPRLPAAVWVFLFATQSALADKPAATDQVDRYLAMNKAIAQARELLATNKPADAAAVLEPHLAVADDNPRLTQLLKSAYTAELNKLELNRGDAGRAEKLRTRLSLLGEQPAPATPPPSPATPLSPSPLMGEGGGGSGRESFPPHPKPPPQGGREPEVVAPAPSAAPTPSPAAEATAALAVLKQAAAVFNDAKANPKKFADAASLFAKAAAGRVELTPDQTAAWAYCKLRLAADRLNQSTDPAAARAAVAEAEAAAALAPGHAGVQEFAKSLTAAAEKRGAKRTVGPPPPATSTPTADGWDTVETGSFRVRFRGLTRPAAEAVAEKAEEHRAAIFARWSAPPGGTWTPKCEVTIHPTAAAFAAATKLPPQATGYAAVKLAEGRAADRRLDLRADDPALADDALPRELTHVVLADLFPDAAPPRWAEEAMAVLAGSPAEVDRYLNTVSRCHRTGELPTAGGLLGMKGLPAADQVTGFSVGSVSLADFLVRLRGEKAFTTFLREAGRYGAEKALQRQYEFADARQLDAAWKRSVLGAK